MSILNTPLFRNFVSPLNCKYLVEAGIQITLPHFWKIYDQAYLKSYAFDFEDFYRSNDKIIDEMNKPKEFLPAFQISELDMLLPDYTVHRNSNGYLLAVIHCGCPTPSTSDRLPDAYAAMVLKLVSKGAINPSNAIEVLNHKIDG